MYIYIWFIYIYILSQIDNIDNINILQRPMSMYVVLST